jgi:spermidine synthase
MITRCIDAEQRLVLRQRGGAVELVAGNVVLLSSAALHTERAFGRLAASESHPARRVLIGGLGFGATLRGALDVVGADARVRVAERVPAVEALVRGELAQLAERPLEDPRASVEHVDVADAIASARGELDAILLDVDNGPHWATFRTNARLYGDTGLAAARRALAPGGVLAVWSGYPADEFAARLRAAGFAARIVLLRERGRVRARAYVGTLRGSV